ncbi:hypothetical protein [Nocardioides sp. SYSU D00065]|uniref:hypothetical protein n=1 Tax=Nocardioides sp. SYSU D00065 TaxID=2817378 RepID=UPI001B3353B9|nr:hypothetical protein [Nocardioides sp. SYSU D00065]
MRRRTPPVLATALLALVVTGCGAGERATEVATDARDLSTASLEPTTLSQPTQGTTVPPSEGLEKVRVVGEVAQVGNCTVVEDDNAITWTITGDRAASLEVGDRVQVTGTPDLVALGCGGPVVRASVVTVVG